MTYTVYTVSSGTLNSSIPYLEVRPGPQKEEPVETAGAKVFTGRMLLLTPNQQCQSIEGYDIPQTTETDRQRNIF